MQRPYHGSGRSVEWNTRPDMGKVGLQDVFEDGRKHC